MKIPHMSIAYPFYRLLKFTTKLFLILLPILIFAPDAWTGLFYLSVLFIGVPKFIISYVKTKKFNLLVDNNFVTITHGLITTDEKTIPLKEIENIDISNSILLGIFNLRKISLKANAANIGIGDISDSHFYLNTEVAHSLRELLIDSSSIIENTLKQIEINTRKNSNNESVSKINHS